VLSWKTENGWRLNVSHSSFSPRYRTESASQPIDLVTGHSNAALREPTQRFAPGLPLKLDALPVHFARDERQNQSLRSGRSIDRGKYYGQHGRFAAKINLLKLRPYLSNDIYFAGPVKR
jgi:hypothetical protein